MTIHILTLFPEMFESVFSESIIKRAKEKGLVTIKTYNLREFSEDKYKTVDDRPYGGGAGMVMKVDVISKAVDQIKISYPNARVILMDAGGGQFKQSKAKELVQQKDIIIICGHYEGVDHRVHEHIADEIISVGPYVLSGGEVPAMTIADSVIRLIPGVLGNPNSLVEESHENGTTEYPQYTRPENYNNWEVPKVLLNGNHKEITHWRNENAQASCSSLPTDSE